MAEAISFLNSISPHVFAYATFVYTIGFLFKLLREERKKNNDDIAGIKKSLVSIEKKVDDIIEKYI